MLSQMIKVNMSGKSLLTDSLATLFKSLGLLVLAFSSVNLQAQSTDDETIAIRDVLTRTQAGMVIESITLSPIPGLYAVQIQNGPVIYASADAQYFIPGDLYTVGNQGNLVNLGEAQRNEIRAAKIAELDESGMIIFAAVGEEKAVLTVFTDVDCQFCRRFHGEVHELNSMGVTVRYLAFPRTGLGTETHQKMISTWCAENSDVMYTSVVRGAAIPELDCENPIAEHYALGREVGVTGTPTLVFSDGTSLPGYVPAETLASYLFSSE